MTGPRPAWDFGYAPSTPCRSEDELAGPCDVIVALRAAAKASAIEAAVAAIAPSARVTLVIDRSPIVWLRIRAALPVPRAAIAAAIAAAELSLRYVAAAARPELELGPALETRGASRARADTWRTRAPSRGSDPTTPGHWFLRAEGRRRRSRAVRRRRGDAARGDRR